MAKTKYASHYNQFVHILLTYNIDTLLLCVFLTMLFLPSFFISPTGTYTVQVVLRASNPRQCVICTWMSHFSCSVYCTQTMPCQMVVDTDLSRLKSVTTIRRSVALRSAYVNCAPSLSSKQMHVCRNILIRTCYMLNTLHTCTLFLIQS